MKKIMKLIGIAGLLMCILSGCNERPQHENAKRFYANFTQLKSYVELLCGGSSPESCRKHVPAVLYVQYGGFPIGWRKDKEMTLPSSAPIDLESEWGTPMKITTSSVGVLTIEVQLPKEDCPVLTESLSLGSLSLSLNQIQIEKSVNGSALIKAKELCKSNLNTVTVTI